MWGVLLADLPWLYADSWALQGCRRNPKCALMLSARLELLSGSVFCGVSFRLQKPSRKSPFQALR